MADEKKPEAADKPLKDLSQEHFKEQIASSERNVNEAYKQIEALKERVQREMAVIGYAQHILTTFKLAEKPPVDDKKKTPNLEVK